MESSVRLRKLDNFLVLDLIGNKISRLEFDLFISKILRLKGFKCLYINIQNFEIMDNNTLQQFKLMRRKIKELPICFVNVSAANNSILNMFKMDKIFQLYMTKSDAIEGKKPIVNRQLKVVGI